VVAPDGNEHRGDGYYSGDGRYHDHVHGDGDRGDYRDSGDRDRWQGGARY
jgi:hypothetical protein